MTDDEVLNIEQTTGKYLLNRINESIRSSRKEGLRVSKIYLTIKTYKEISFYIETKINTYIQRDPKEDPRKNFTLFGNKCEVSDYDDFGNLITNDYLIIYE